MRVIGIHLINNYRCFEYLVERISNFNHFEFQSIKVAIHLHMRAMNERWSMAYGLNDTKSDKHEYEWTVHPTIGWLEYDQLVASSAERHL